MSHDPETCPYCQSGSTYVGAIADLPPEPAPFHTDPPLPPRREDADRYISWVGRSAPELHEPRLPHRILNANADGEDQAAKWIVFWFACAVLGYLIGRMIG